MEEEEGKNKEEEGKKDEEEARKREGGKGGKMDEEKRIGRGAYG